MKIKLIKLLLTKIVLYNTLLLHYNKIYDENSTCRTNIFKQNLSASKALVSLDILV